MTDNDFFGNELDDNLEEGSVRYIEAEYECENCNYRWRKTLKAYLSDEDRRGDRWDVDDYNVTCPMCGSHNVYRK